MKKLLTFLFGISALSCFSQAIFSNAYGDPTKPAIVFMHGGPGYNAVSFELAAADKLSDLGYYVITFDQRGSGRSKKDSITDHYTFNKASVDINTVLKKYNVSQATFIGHSWGGTEAIAFAKSYPEKVKAVILLSSPINYQLGFRGIIQHCEEKFRAKKDSSQLKYLANVKKLDSLKLEYASMCFLFAMNSGLYSPHAPTAERQAIYDEMKKNKKAEYLSKMTTEPVYGFYANERYTTLDMRYDIKQLQQKGIAFYGIYGKDDGLFNTEHFEMAKKSVGETNFILVENASHNVFIDQREEFLKAVKKYMTPLPVEEKKKK